MRKKSIYILLYMKLFHLLVTILTFCSIICSSMMCFSYSPLRHFFCDFDMINFDLTWLERKLHTKKLRRRHMINPERVT